MKTDDRARTLSRAISYFRSQGEDAHAWEAFRLLAELGYADMASAHVAAWAELEDVGWEQDGLMRKSDVVGLVTRYAHLFESDGMEEGVDALLLMAHDIEVGIRPVMGPTGA